ncbi:hypothetical protein CYMTET_9859 [Cymbomonas tetramitiformis]|uniref:Uncharacterized protein n=1 Tax=Cymbomonas tetramitiformis TaxID=36881 RepID=A0AAE0GQT5_9CHLO|nr:hypothetical protein CYMTET_9859 [Cymbomonas tetramitiformis]
MYAATPATPTATAAPAASTSAAQFVAAVRTNRTRHVEKAAKFVAKKCFGSKEERFHGDEKGVQVIFTRMVAALREAFVAENVQLDDIFTLDDATITSPWTTAWTPTIVSWTSTPRSSPRKNTRDEDDVKSQFIQAIQAMDSEYYRHVVSRLLLHDQRAAESLLTVQQWARECHAAHVRAGTAVPKGSAAIGSMLPARFGEPPGGHGSADSDVMEILLALRKEDVEGDFYAAAFQHAIDNNAAERFDALCYLAGDKPVMLEDISAASFCIGDAVEEHAIDEYLQRCQPADTRFGACGVGGALNINAFKVHDNAPVVPPPPAAPAAPPSVVSDGGMYPVRMLHAHEPDVSFTDKIADGFGLSGPDPPLTMHCMGPVVSVDSVSVAGEDSEDADDDLPPPRRALSGGKPPLGFGRSALTSLAVSMLFLACATAVPATATAFGGVGVGADTAPPVGGAIDACPGVLLAAASTLSTPSIDNRGLGSASICSTHEFSATPQLSDDEVGGTCVLSPAAIPPFRYWQPAGWYWNLHALEPGWIWHPGPSEPPVVAPILPMPPSPGGTPPSPDYTPPASDEEDEGGPSSIDYDYIDGSSFSSAHVSSDDGDPACASGNSGTGSPGLCNSG